MKRFLSVVLAIALIFACAPAIPLIANAATSGHYTYTVSKGKATITDCNTSISGDITIPATLGGYPVTSIGSSAFWNCSSLTSVVIPDSVTSIGSSAFWNCSSLTSVVIGDSVTSIGSSAFSSCRFLTSVVIGDSVTSIDSHAFSYCSSLTSVVIGNSVASIGDSAFSFCSSLTSVEIPDSVTSIGSHAFSPCSSLTGIWVDADNTAYCSDEQGVLYNKAKTTLIQAPGGITECTIADSVTSIGSYAFYNCSSLTGIEIPDSMTSIGNYAFFSCSRLTSVVIPDSVTSIGNCAFSSCSSLTSVVIPDSVTSIGDYAFQNCSSLTSVVIGDSVGTIGKYAFQDCSSLTDVYYGGTEKQWSAIAINSYNGNLTDATIHYDTAVLLQSMEDGKEISVGYTTLAEALIAANSGTIKLLADTTADTVVLKPGVTLDLNGYTSTADLFVAMNGAKVLDGGENCTGGGSLKIAKGNLALAKDNGGVIPVWNGTDGYIFTKVTFQQLARPLGNGAAQYIFLPSFSNAEAAALLADGGADNGVKIKVSLNWGNGQSQQFYTYSDDLVQKVFDGTGSLAFDLSVTGIAGIEDMTAQAVVVTDSGAQATNVSTAIVAG